MIVSPGQFHAVVTSPVEYVVIQRDKLPHTVEKRIDARERYALFIHPTLTNPYEIWRTEYDDGIRSRYIASFSGDNDIVVMVRVEPNGNIMWKFMQREARRMNKLRLGELIYYRK